MTIQILETKQLHTLGYNGSSVNCKNWNGSGDSNAAGDEAIAFYKHTSATLVLAAIVNGVVTVTDSTYSQSTVPNTNAVDSHCIAHAKFDGDGVLHCWFGNHADAVKYWKGADASDRLIDHQSTPMVSGSTTESEWTYPFAERLNNGNLVNVRRYFGSGNGNTVLDYYKTVANGGPTWTEATLIDGISSGESPYPNGRIAYDPTVGTAGRLWICWNWTSAPTNQDHHDLDAAYSDDGGVSWKGALTNASLTLPISRTGNSLTECRIRTQAKNTGLINVGAACIDKFHNLVTINTWSKNADNASQFFCTFKNELGNWETVEVGLASSTFSYTTTIIADIPNPYPFGWGPFKYYRGKFFFVCRVDELDTTMAGGVPGLWCYVADGPYPRTWTLHRLADNVKFGGGVPSHNETIWRARRLISMLVQECYEPTPAPPVTGPTPVYRYLFAPLHELVDTMVSGKLTPYALTVLANKFRNNPAEYYVPTSTHTVHMFQSGTEVSGGNYAPKSIANNGTTYTTSGRSVTLAIDVVFPDSSASWGTPDEYRIKDANGVTLARVPIATPAAIASGKRVTIPAGQIVFTADAGCMPNAQVIAHLGWLFGNAALSTDATRYGQYYLGDPGSGGTPLGARVAMTQSAVFDEALGGATANLSGIAITDQPTATHWAEFDALSGGTLKCSGALASAPSGNTINTSFLRTELS